ncbi:TPA: shikimate kinase [Candidatus Woesearchaeota archaeon]|nr:shikimate kinase [Candidatus Woesearchaeota archaeon]HIH39241.1 shikimate kinase [Candidatus Woesearchaeota archaeon]
MNITLIGMAGAGKTTLGKELAGKLGYIFLDVDELIERKTKLKLQQVIDRYGDSDFIKIEEETVLNLKDIDNHVISPGGSVIYSRKAMEFLKKISKLVFLDAPFDIISKRIVNKESRGIVGLKNKDLLSLFNERRHLYEKYADIVIDISKDFNIDYLVSMIK